VPNLIQFLVGSYLEPQIAGSSLSITPFVVLFAVFFWTSLWGIAGTFIGVPIVIAIPTIRADGSRTCSEEPPTKLDCLEAAGLTLRAVWSSADRRTGR
jgi:AI-2E family transporter